VLSDFDAIVVGSGFGGAITACRLAEAGHKVLVLERGRRWTVQSYPRLPDDPWLWDASAPHLRNGWFDFRVFPHMSVVQGAGVGGGSLVYANISIEAKKETFDGGWPPEVTFDELKPHYARVGQMLDVKPVPQKQWPDRTKLLKDAAERAGLADRFRPLELAVSFDPDWTYDQPNPHAVSRSKAFTNAHGQPQGTCVHLGNCDIGCDVAARNTLDLNYLPLAERHGAEVRPLHLVTQIAPETGGYRVSFNRIETPNLIAGQATARIVVIASGSLGSTELLLRCRDVTGTLPNLSARLGKGWSSNGDFLTPAIHPFRPVNPTKGPTITAAIDLLDHGADGRDVFIEDGGFPSLVEGVLRRWTADNSDNEFARAVIESLRPLLAANHLTDHVMPWFAQARDAADGTLSLQNGRLALAWDVAASEQTMEAVVHMHQRLARETGGMALTPLTWTLARALITPHPLGGCNMGRTAADGVVAHTGEVFGYHNLFVADGSIVPKAIGLNPSRTIGALAERVAAHIVADGR
jgi:cholesterol oxidase